MSKQELTPWFPADVKPVHIGWYHTSCEILGFTHESEYNWWWDGENWLAYPDSRAPSLRQIRKWRGLANNQIDCKS